VLPGGKVVVPGTTYLAGSGVLTDACVNQLLTWREVSLAEAIDMASVRPRQLLGLPACSLEPGSAVDVMLFDWKPDGEFRITGMLTTSATGQYNR
jgi:N-acetylglucosamine-6-phosphate deacetylase